MILFSGKRTHFPGETMLFPGEMIHNSGKLAHFPAGMNRFSTVFVGNKIKTRMQHPGLQ
jgi:hypothetical protein